MADKQYLANRLKYHTASRVANQTGDSLAATFNVDGHIVRDSSVWTSPLSAFPLQSNKKNADPIGATENLVGVFKKGAVSGAFWNGGAVWTNTAYPAVKLYENVPMTPVAASLGQNMNSGAPTGTARYQAYEILAAADGISEGELRVTEWVAPPAIVDPETGSPVAGYTGLQMLSGTTLQKYPGCTANTAWGLGGGHWEFVYMAGILTFEMGCTPEEIGAKSTKGLTLTAFKYCGEKLEGSISTINSDIDVLQTEVDTITLVTEPIKTVSAKKTVTYNGGKTIVGTAVEAAISDAATGEVAVTLEGKDFELLSFYQKYANGQMEIIYPEISKTVITEETAANFGNSIYTLTADYGEAVSGITSSLVWEINCKVK